MNGQKDPRLVKPVCHELQPVRLVHDNPWFAVLERGGYFTTEFRERPVIVLPVLDNEAVLMVRPRRPVIADSPLELPAGGIQQGEDACQAGRRELFEETGIWVEDLGRFVVLPALSNSPGRDPCLINVLRVDLTWDEYRSRGNSDEEIEQVLPLDYYQAFQMMVSGKLYVGVPMAIIAVQLLKLIDAKTSLKELL